MSSEERQTDTHTRADQERDEPAVQHAEVEAQPRARILVTRTRVVRAVLALIATIAVVAAVGFGWAFMAQRDKATAQFRDATAARLYAQSQLQLTGLSPTGNDDVAAMQMLLAARSIPSTVRGDDYLLAALSQERDLLKAIDTPAKVFSVAVSPDGRIASAGADTTVRVWDAGTGQPTGEPLRGHEDAVMSVAFSPDGTRIASGSRDNTVRLWDAKTGQPIGQPMRHDNAVFSVAFSPDGTRIASGSMDKTLRLWDAKTGQPIGQPMTHDGGVTRVAFSPDGTRIASGSIDKAVRLWDAKTGQPIGQPMSGHDQWVMSVAFSPDGTRIASGSIDKTLRLWDAKTGQPIGQPMTHDSAVPTVAFSPDGTRIASGSGDNKIRLWDASTGAASGNLTGHRSAVETVAFSPDGLRLVSGGDDQTVRIWNISSSQPLLGHEDAVAYAEFSEDGQRIRSGSLDGTVRRWDSATGRPIGQPLRVADHVRWLIPEGEDRVLSRGDAGLRLWDAHTGQPVGEPVRVITDPILPAGAWNSKTGRIGAQTQPGAIEIRDAELKRLGVPIWPGQPVSYFDFSPDGRTIVTSSVDSTVRLWDVETGKPVGQPLDSQGLILTIAFSPDGHLLAAGTQGATENAPNALRLWDIRTSQPVGDPVPVDSVVTATVFSPDGRTLATGSADGMIRLWDVDTKTQLGASLTGHTSIVTSLSFSPDGTRLLSTSVDRALRVWPLPKASPDALCAKLTRNMSRNQWKEWVSPEIDYITACPGLPIAGDE